MYRQAVFTAKVDYFIVLTLIVLYERIAMLAESITLFVSLWKRFKPTDSVDFGVLYVEALRRVDNLFFAIFAVVIHFGTFFLLFVDFIIKEEVSHKTDFTIANICKYMFL